MKGKKDITKIDSLIGIHTIVEGNIHFAGGLHIEGKVNGNVLSDEGQNAFVILTESGVVEGEVRSPTVILHGTVKGDVYATESLELAIHANVHGNVYYNLMKIAVGAAVDGNLIHAMHDVLK